MLLFSFYTCSLVCDSNTFCSTRKTNWNLFCSRSLFQEPNMRDGIPLSLMKNKD
jgi:hypothetical protein